MSHQHPVSQLLALASILAASISIGGPLAAAPPSTPFAPEKAGFAVAVGDEICPYRVLGVYALPGQDLDLAVVQPRPGEAFDLAAEHGRVLADGPTRWTWRAPGDPGLYPVAIRRRGSDEAIRLNVFVMVPYTALEGERLNGYRIGRYPAVPLRNLAIYRPPLGFVEVTPENRDTPVSPHFTLGQFLCKQEGGYPRYVVLRERLLLKLEALLAAVNERGFRADTFFVMSGYRTPHYNRAIGNVQYSRHQWGGAADIFIDVDPRDGVMDDLNRDGRVDGRDADLLYDLFESLEPRPGFQPFVGGMGRYGNAPNHGPFVHVDARGFRARWGR